MLAPRRAGRTRFLILMAWGLLAAGPRVLAAQSLTGGALRGVVRSQDGVPLPQVSVTIESKMGNPVKVLLTDGGGSFRIPLLPVGEYRILAELAGFQPVRHVGVLVSASRATSVAITLERRPPPITSVTQVENSGASAATSSGRVIRSDEIRHFQYRRDAADVLRGTTALVRASDGREGLGLASLGLPASWTQVVVDGVPDLLLRHPGYPADPAALPVFGRFALDQMQVLGAPTDLEWRGTAGSIVAMQTRRGENRLTFSPYATFSSASIAKRPTENPADSAATSFEVGAVLSGPIVRDTAQFQLHFNYQSLERPTPFPWENNAANYQGQGVSLRQQLAAIAADSFGTAVDGYLAPVVRSWRVINGGGRVDWRLSNTQSLMARFDYSDVREHAPQLGEDLVSGAQTELSARDLSGAVTLTRVGDGTANELRTGFTMAKRTYTAAPLPETRLVAEGVAFGGSAALPGGFDVKAADLSDAFQVTFGRHQLKLGGNLTLRSYSQDYLFGAAGVYTFGDLDQFGAARGTFFQTVGPSRSADFNATEFGLFLQDTWALSPEIQLLLGIRYEAEFLPKTKATSWDSLTGVRTALFKNDTKRIQPRVGFIWDVQNKGEWIVRGSTGLSNPRISPALIAEALLYDGRITVNRGLGTFTGWPTLPESAALVNVGPRITILNSTVRSPRSFKSELGLSRNLGNGFSLNLSGSYDHTDFLARRTDLNLAEAGGATQEGRPVFGTLVEQGGLVTPTIGSNRRFQQFDLVSGLAPTGFSDYYEATASIERQVSRGVSIVLSYTYSKTTDNLLGQRSADPTDQLDPFPGGLNGAAWGEGRSDFDVPHRLTAWAQYRGGASFPVTLGARYRLRSGLPFTPGFRPGVDVNGDGSGNNDPAFLGAAIPGMQEALAQADCDASSGGFAVRNSCREKMHQALDLQLSVEVPLAGRHAVLSIEAFNVVATKEGIVDRALFLIDPTRPLVSDGGGNVTLPLVANPGFGTLLSRRGEPRVVRVGVKVDY